MEQLKEQFLLDPDVIFLNHGSFGATPKPVFDAYQRWQLELERQPVEFLGRRHNGLMQKSREALGEYFNTSANNLVYTSNVTVSINIVARSLKLGPNDEVLASDHEYGACDRTWRFLASENGFKYINQPIPLPVTTLETFVDDFWQGVTPRTKVIFLSHITSPTAIIFPVAEVCRRAREQGILTVVDGAHAPGQIPLDLEAIGADFYGGNLHKWLCAPKGAGFLYARPDAQHILKPLVVSWGYESEIPGESQFVDHYEWIGTRDIAAFLAVPDAIQFQAKHDWDSVRATAHELLRYAQREICELSGLPALHPDDKAWFAQMGTAPLPVESDLGKLKTRLYDDYRIEVPLILWNGRKLIRISVQGYNDQNDIDKLLSALRSNS
jgi:isopenicillin-N epimerase